MLDTIMDIFHFSFQSYDPFIVFVLFYFAFYV